MLIDKELVKTDTTGWYLKDIEPEVECERAIYLIPKATLFRRLCYNISKHKAFDNIIMLLIGLSSLKLATDTYMAGYSKDSTEILVSEICDSVFTWCFTLECVIKVFALGFIMDDGSYLRAQWNQLDFFIVVTSLFDFFFRNVDIPFIKILRLLRTIRPLRVISHNKSL